MPKTFEEIHKLAVGTFGTELGKRYLSHLEDVFVNVSMYKKGMTLEEVAYRQGQADLIKQLKIAMKDKPNGN